ncbi:MAG: MiaB/RimO family radical SAM methylthiotransferase [Thermoguttaceae bacterium]
MTFSIITFGCKVNQYESEWLRQSLVEGGWCEATQNDSPELVVVNTCTITATSDSKCRKAIRHLVGVHPNAEFVVIGCYAARSPETIREIVPHAETLKSQREVATWLERRGVVPLTGLVQAPQRHRAQVKVQDGCPMQCAYCIVPRVRPQILSRPVDEVVCEVTRLAADGCREFVLTGIHLGFYGRDFSAPCTLVDLLRELLAIPELRDVQFRLSSLEASEANESLARLMHDEPLRIVPHLHLPLQSGSDAVLKRMNRASSVASFSERVAMLREIVGDISITTDIIAGFPGETDDDFAQTLLAVESLRFSKVHTFRYSRREGTPAATFAAQVPELVKSQRSATLERVANEVRRACACERIGKRERVMIESRAADGQYVGTSASYFETLITSDTPLRCGEIVTVAITNSTLDAQLVGHYCRDALPTLSVNSRLTLSRLG